MLVVGAGRVAHEKVSGLLDCGAAVTVVAPESRPRSRRSPSSCCGAGTGAPTSTAATSSSPPRADPAVNTRVFADAEARALLCNVVDVPELCSFILPALHREDPITVAVSTGGASPVLAQRLRDEIARSCGPSTQRWPCGCASCARGRRRTCPPTRRGATTSPASCGTSSDDGLPRRSRPGRPGADHGTRARPRSGPATCSSTTASSHPSSSPRRRTTRASSPVTGSTSRP